MIERWLVDNRDSTTIIRRRTNCTARSDGAARAVGAFAPGVVFAQADAGPAEDAVTETEPNGYYGTANPIELDQRVRGIVRPYDTDTFAVNVTQPGARITVDAVKEAVGDYTNLSVTISSPNDEYLGPTQISGSETNGTALATALDRGTYYVSVGVNHATFPYEFEVATGDRINVSVASPVQTAMEVALYSPNGTVLQSPTLYRDVNFSVTANRSGTYRVVVRQNTIQPSLRGEYPYDLTVNVTGTGAAPADSDGDSLTDDEEAQYGTNPTDPDTDGDGLTDYVEVTRYETDPTETDTDTDTDDDGWSDRSETNRGCDPLDAESHP